MAIFKRKDKSGVAYGGYRICVYRGKDDKGQKIYHWETFDGNIKAAKERETEIKHQIHTGQFVKPGKLTTGNFLDKWLKDYSKPNNAESTHEVYEQQVNNHIKPALGNMPLAGLTNSIISGYFSDKIKEGLSNTTVIHHRTMLHKSFQTAIEWGLLQYNPVDGATKLKRQRPEMETYSPDEINTFLNIAKEKFPEYHPVFVLCLHCGVRRSEVLGLKWKDVDDLFTSISINRTLLIIYGPGTKKIVYGEPKTEKSRRLIPLTPTASLVLKNHHKWYKDMLVKVDRKFSDDLLVFCHLDNGEPFRPDTITRAWSRIAKLSGLKHIRLHDARHTMASTMLRSKIHPKIVQERLGHSNIATTLDLYSHVIPSLQEEAAKALDEAFKTPYNNSVENNTDCQNTAHTPDETLHKE